MSRMLHPVHIDHPQKLIEIITDIIDEIQKGAVILDTAVGNNEYDIDLVAAVDETKTGMLLFLNLSGQELDFLRSFKCLRWYHENLNLFQKLYAGKIDFDQLPYIIFIAPHFSPGIQKVLLNLTEGCIILLKYTCFQDGQEIKVFLEKIADSSKTEEREGTPQDTAESCPKTCPENLIPLTSSASAPKQTIDLKKFRQEFEIDISNISDEELLKLLE